MDRTEAQLQRNAANRAARDTFRAALIAGQGDEPALDRARNDYEAAIAAAQVEYEVAIANSEE